MAAKPRKPMGWFKREAAVMVLVPVTIFALGLLLSLIGPSLLRLFR